METIIQVSDFHISVSSSKPYENQVFMGLIECIKELKLTNSILVYNGDVIDFESIRNTAELASTTSEKALIWEQEASRAYALAKEYFDLLTRELQIPNDRIIICCGNHDVNVYVEGSKPVACPDAEIAFTYSDIRFKQFSEFCNSIQLMINASGTYFRELGNLNFLVLNSNWKNKWIDGKKQSLCIACKEIGSVIASQKSKLQFTIENMSKTHNIVVCHAPSSDFCEEALYRYKGNERNAIFDEIDRYFGLQLYGDKHTDSIKNHDYIVGAPLSESIITCGIHEFDEYYHHHHRTLKYENGGWSVIGSEKYVRDILDISIGSVKGQALEYLFGTRELDDLDKKIIGFDQVRSSVNWNALDRLIRASADIQKPQSLGAGTPVRVVDGFVNTLTRLVTEASTRVAITVRGEPRVGKSVCMSVLYLNMLHRFTCGTFEYVPIYIDIEQLHSMIKEDDRDTEFYVDAFSHAFTEKLKKGVEIAEQLHKPACCIIDGLNKYYLYNNARVEDIVEQYLEGTYKTQYARLVYCIDTEDNKSLGFAPQHVKKDAEHVVYFNRLLTKKVRSVKKYQNFVKAFCELKGASYATVEQVISNIEKMSILEVDTSLLINFWDQICETADFNFFRVLDAYAQSRIGSNNIKQAAQAAYLYWRGKNYSEIQQTCNVTYNVLELIRTQRMLRKYLIAANYVFQVQNLKSNRKPDECMNLLYNHEICTFIREHITKLHLQAQLLRYAEEKYKALNSDGRATITFLIGRVMHDRNKTRKLLGTWKKVLSDAERTKSASDYTSAEIALRSIIISEIFVERNATALQMTYVNRLIANQQDRLINRMFYLQFYGDRKFGEYVEILDGFDIYYTYYLLASRLNRWYNDEVHYPLLELELYTLCDLIQIRLDNPIAQTRNGKGTVKSFFYNPKYSHPKDDMAYAVVTFMIKVISKYIEAFGNTKENVLFIRYLYMQLDIFQNAQAKLSSGSYDISDKYEPVNVYRKLLALKDVNRTGWFLNDVVSFVSKSEFDALRNRKDAKETTLIHTYEAFLIGLIYLPERIAGREDYCKDSVLKILLLHDLGEVEVGDIIPQYEDYSRAREKEKEFCNILFLQGTHEGIADLTGLFSLWQEWCNEYVNNINITVAKEIDKIQMLYKMLSLLRNGEIGLTKDRVQNLWLSKNKIVTDEGKRIFNTIIVDGNFDEILRKYDIRISRLR